MLYLIGYPNGLAGGPLLSVCPLVNYIYFWQHVNKLPPGCQNLASLFTAPPVEFLFVFSVSGSRWMNVLSTKVSVLVALVKNMLKLSVSVT